MEAATSKKLLLAGVGIGLLLLVNRAGQVADTIDGLTFKIGVGGAPKINGLSITFPVKVLVSNPNPVTLPLQGLAMTLHRLGKNGISTPIAATSPNGVVVPSIQRNAVTEFIVPVTTDFFTALTEVITDIRAGSLGRYLLNTTIVSAGVKVDLPAQTLTF